MKGKKNITDPEYSVFNAYNFFIAHDYVRVIILFYILFGFILNILIIIAIIASKKKLSVISKITLSILAVNFFHTFSYLYEWVIKINGESYQVGEEKDKTSVGFLLVGSPKKMGACLTQAFSLISSSISQDFLINIFFYLINKSDLPKLIYVYLSVFIFAFVIPMGLTFILLFTGSLGINDKFCYVNKYNYNFKYDNKNIGDEKAYKPYRGFELCVTIVYAVRTLNLLFSLYIIFIIVKYIIIKNLKFTYIFKIASILLIQLVTISVGLIYRISSFFSKKFSVDFAGAYLILNTMDGVLFPLSFMVSNGMHRLLFKLITGKKIGDEEVEDEQFPKIDDGESSDDNESNSHEGVSIPMTDLSNKKYNEDE